MQKPPKFVVADFWMLICAAAMLLAFLILPWVVGATGLRVLMGTEEVPRTVQSGEALFLIPAAAALGLLLVLWGIIAPRQKRIAAWLTLLAGLVGIAYYVVFIGQNSANFGSAIRFVGAGFWIAFLGAVGLAVQVAAPRPRLTGAGRLTAQAERQESAAGAVGGCLLAPFGFVRRQMTAGCLVIALAFGACAACALLAPATFQALIDAARNAGLRTYVLVLEVTGNPALKLITYEASVTAITAVERDMGILGLLYGEGAEVRGTVQISLGADLQAQKVGILNCAIDTDTLQTFVGRAALAGTAFDKSDIEREAYRAFKAEAARQAIEQFWPEARNRLLDQFVSWGLGLEAPEVPDLTTCPTSEAQTTPAAP